MDAFEHIVARIFETEGFWVRVGYKVDLSKETKQRLGNPNMPRPEIDVLAYTPAKQQLLLIECKGFGSGVDYESLSNPMAPNAKRFKLFHNNRLYRAVVDRLLQQLKAEGALASGHCEVKLCLAPAKIKRDNEPKMQMLFERKKWILHPPHWLLGKLHDFAGRGYENDVVTCVVKLLAKNSEN